MGRIYNNIIRRNKMKKVLMAICFLVLMSTQVWAYDNDTSYTQMQAKGGLVKFIYTGLTVTAGDSIVSKITTPGPFGDIKEIYFESLSTDCQVFLSEEDDLTAPNDSTIINMSGINLVYSPELSTLRTYINRETVQVEELYLTVVPTTADTGAWTLVITYKTY
jgi:hypothetical protein